MIWLVVPCAREGARGAGQWKDLHGIRIVLDRLGGEWSEFRFDERNVDELIARIGQAHDTVIWYYSFWPEQMERLKERCPQVRLVLRTVNAEALQHWTRADKDWRRWRGLPRDLYGFLRLLHRDRRCCRAADALAGISPWDDDHYWRRLAGREKVTAVPYASPWPVLLPSVKPMDWDVRVQTIACLSGTRDPIGQGHVAGFAALARNPALAGWRFVASDGFMDASRDGWPSNVERLGRIEDPYAVLCTVKAVALLSPLGFGCKTTVADALAAGCQVLIHPRQHVRLSKAEQAFCIPIDPATEADARRAAHFLSRLPVWDAGRIWQAQMTHALAAWRGVLDA